MTFGEHILTVCKAAHDKGTQVTMRFIADAIDRELPVWQAAHGPKGRPGDLLFEVLAEIDGANLAMMTKTERGKVNAARTQIVQATPDCTADEIRERAERYKRLHPTWPCTSAAIVKHWSALAEPVARAAVNPDGPAGWRKVFMDWCRIKQVLGWTLESGHLYNAKGESTSWRHIPTDIQRELLEMMDGRGQADGQDERHF